MPPVREGFFRARIKGYATLGVSFFLCLLGRGFVSVFVSVVETECFYR